MKNKKLFFCIFFIAIAFFLRSYLFLDPDFGWHIRNGQLFLSEGIFYKDPYSYTMSSFPVVSHEWSVDILWAIVFTLGGKLLLAILWSIIQTITVYIVGNLSIFNAQHKQIRLIYGSIFFLFFTLILPYAGIRVQVLSWLLFALLAKLLLDRRYYKFQIVLPIFFLLWANIHGSFVLGLGAYFIVLFLDIIQNRKVNFPKLILFLVSVGSTFINPFIIGVWKEVWLSMSDSQLKWRIAEWRPALMVLSFPLAFFIALSSVLIIRYRKKFPIQEIALFLLFFVLALLNNRNIVLWGVITTPLILKGLVYFYEEIRLKKAGLKRLRIASIGFVIISAIISLLQGLIVLQSSVGLQERTFYPVSSVSYLIKSPPNGNIFSDYGWGGYLIWKLPSRKVFIDGRMPSWRWTANIPGETNNAMDDYLHILDGTLHFKKQFEKYHVDTVLFSREKSAKQKESIINWIYSLTGVGINIQEYDFLEDLERNHWQKVYEDDIAVIYQKPS